MTTSLVDLVMRFLTPDTIGRIASALGINRSIMETAINAAVPGLLTAFGSAASTPGGAQRLADAAKQSSMLDNFAGSVGGSSQSSLVDQGVKVLGSLFGGEEQSQLTGAVAKFAGIGQNTATSLLGMLTPVALGAIGKELGASGANASGVADLFEAQQDQIAAAMPTGFARQLNATGIFDSVSGMAERGAATARKATRTVTAATEDTAGYAYSAARNVADSSRRAAATSGVPNWVYWAIPLAVIAGAIWYFSANQPQTTTIASTAPQVQITAPGQVAVPGVQVAAVDVNRQLDQSLTTLRTSLQGVRDATTATAALPKLNEVTNQIDKVGSMFGQLSPDARRQVVGLGRPAMASLNEMFDSVLAIPGVSEIIKPTVDTLKQKLATFAT